MRTIAEMIPPRSMVPAFLSPAPGSQFSGANQIPKVEKIMEPTCRNFKTVDEKSSFYSVFQKIGSAAGKNTVATLFPFLAAHKKIKVYCSKKS